MACACAARCERRWRSSSATARPPSAAVRRLNGVHAAIRGEATDPRRARRSPATTYRAMDPELLLWVQVTLVWTSVQAYERWVGPLDGADREELWAEAREVGRRLGIPLEVSPPDWPALEAYWDRMLAPDGPIAITPTARRLARLDHPAADPRPPRPGHRPPGDARPGAACRRGSAIGVRHAMGPDPRVDGEPRRPGCAPLGRAMPLAWRSMPQARAADRRVRGAAHGGAGGAGLVERAAARVATIHRTRHAGADRPCLARTCRVAPSSPASAP